MEKIDCLDFVVRLKTGLYQCGQIALAFKGKVVKEEKKADSKIQLSTSVTAVDRLCQEIILLRVFEITPGIEIYSEELEVCSPRIRDLFAKNRSRYELIIDPLDGTDCFIKEGVEYAHMVGILDLETGKMECGLIYFPETAQLYFGIRGLGSFVVKGLFNTPERLLPRQPIKKTFGQIKRLKTSDYEAFGKIGFSLGTSENKPSAYDLISVARGELGAMVMRGFHGHDSAIASIIIEELGGLVLSDDGKAVIYEKSMPRIPLVISSLVSEYATELYEAQA